MKFKKLASNAAYLTLDWASITLLSSFFWIAIGKFLDSSQLGIISTSFNLASVIQFFTTLGIGLALAKLISEYSGNNKKFKIAGVIKPAIKILAVTNAILILVIILFNQFLSSALKLTPDTLFITAGIAIALSISNVSGYVLLGFQNMKKYMLTNLAYHLIKLASSTILILLGFKFFGPLIGLTLGLILLILFRFEMFKFIRSDSKNSKSNYKEILKFSIPALVGGLATIAFNNVPYITLTVIKDLSITGIFAPAMLLATPLFIFPNTFTSALFPVVSSLSGNLRSTREEGSLIKATFRYAIFLTIPLATFLIFFPEQIISILFKPEYLPAAELLKILSIGALLQGLGGIFLGSIYALKKPGVQQNILILVAAIFTIMSIPFTFYFSAVGMSISYVIAAAILFIISYFYIRRMVTASIPYHDILKILIATVVMVVFVILSKPMISHLASILLIIPSVLVYLVVLLALGFYNELDLRLIDYLKARLPKYFKMPLELVSALIENRLNLFRKEKR